MPITSSFLTTPALREVDVTTGKLRNAATRCAPRRDEQEQSAPTPPSQPTQTKCIGLAPVTRGTSMRQNFSIRRSPFSGVETA